MQISKRSLIIAVILIAFSYLFYSAYKDAEKRTLDDFNFQQFALAKQASRGIESFFIYYQRELQFLSKVSYVVDLNEKGKGLLAEFYKNHSDQIEAISLIDSGGILRYTYPFDESVIGRDISDQLHIKAVLATHETTVSDVFTTVQGYRAIAFHQPVMEGKKFKGSIGILIAIDKLGKRFIENVRTGETGYGTMISKDGIELFNPVAPNTGKQVREIYQGFPQVLSIIDRSLESNEGASVCNFHTDQKTNKTSDIIAGFYRIPLYNTFWTIFIFTPEKEVLSKLTSFRNSLFVLFIIILGVVGTYFYLTLKASNIVKEEKRRKKVEAELSESEKRFRVIFELSPAGIILINENSDIIEVNPSFCDILGYSRQELLGQNIRLFANPENSDEIDNNIKTILSGETMIHEVSNYRKDGTKCIVALYETRFPLPDGRPGILSVSNDITEMKKAQDELIKAKEKAEESDRLKSTFLATISHELRTPLNAIIGFSNIIAENSKDNNTIRNSKIILNSGYHLLSLVEDIFDITGIETGQMKISYKSTNIARLLNEVYNIMLGERIRENKPDIELILNKNNMDNSAVIMTDSRRVKQVLINLLKNAVKFTDNGYVEFGLSEEAVNDNDYLQFYVKDTGIGIDRKHHELVFNIFRQIDDTRTRKAGGTGLGLSISKKIIEKLGGKIWIESEPGFGSVFSFTIPREPNIPLKSNKNNPQIT